MNIDIGSGEVVYGDVGFTYAEDKAVDRHITAYDAWLDREFGIRPNPNAPVHQYLDPEDIFLTLQTMAVYDAVALFKHSIEHMDCPLEYIRAVKPFVSTIIVITPNAATNNADYVDHTHVYAWLSPTMNNFLGRALGVGWTVSERVDVEREVTNGRDLVFIARKNE